MKIKAILLVFIVSLSISAMAQNTKTTETNEKTERSEKSIEDKETSKNDENSNKTNKEKSRESWKITDTKNPFDRPTTNKFITEIEDAGTVTLKNGVEIIKPVTGYQLNQINLPNKSIAHYFLAPDEFKPSKDAKQLVQVKKTKDYIIYTWCPCKTKTEKCPCEKKKVVKIIANDKR
ncbi:MAG: hypothetical protein KDC94_11500 [Aequorivita sp.]|nr:hypothetical protein [Aequorivita sp.]MCB0455557.1 hypothetical protein [Aequorivita sp.]MCB0467522.1 hypothetical protein [Aequorivita sp.]HPE83579.1 hypothetical protein [Aequorivita sp.]